MPRSLKWSITFRFSCIQISGKRYNLSCTICLLLLPPSGAHIFRSTLFSNTPCLFPLAQPEILCLPYELHLLYDPLFRDEHDRVKPLHDCHVGSSTTESHSKYGNCSAGYTVRGSNSGRGKSFFSPTKRPVLLWDPPSLLLSVYRGTLLG